MPLHPAFKRPFKSKNFISSLGYALCGLYAVLQTEQNFRTHIILTLLVTFGGWYFHVSRLEWVALILCIMLMLAVEALNTAIEYLVDWLANDHFNERAKVVKDIAAGACLTTAIGSAIVGAIIFWPYLSRAPH